MFIFMYSFSSADSSIRFMAFEQFYSLRSINAIVCRTIVTSNDLSRVSVMFFNTRLKFSENHRSNEAICLWREGE